MNPSSPPLQTRCSHCRSSFPITREQLDLRQGFVRCGKCQQVFQAREHLSVMSDQDIELDRLRRARLEAARVAEAEAAAEVARAVKKPLAASPPTAAHSGDPSALRQKMAIAHMQMLMSNQQYSLERRGRSHLWRWVIAMVGVAAIVLIVISPSLVKSMVGRRTASPPPPVLPPQPPRRASAANPGDPTPASVANPSEADDEPAVNGRLLRSHSLPTGDNGQAALPQADSTRER